MTSCDAYLVIGCVPDPAREVVLHGLFLRVVSRQKVSIPVPESRGAYLPEADTFETLAAVRGHWCKWPRTLDGSVNQERDLELNE